jgi:hypothetical protein
MLSSYDLGAAMAAPPRQRERAWSERDDVSPLTLRPQEDKVEEEEKKGEVEKEEGSGEKDSYGLSPGILNWRPQSPFDYARYERELALSDVDEDEGEQKEEEKKEEEKKKGGDAGGEESEEEEKFVPWKQPSPWPDYSHELEEEWPEGFVPWEVLSPYQCPVWYESDESEEGEASSSTLTPEEKKIEESEKSEESDDEWFPYRLPSPWHGYSGDSDAPFPRTDLDGNRETMVEWLV